MKKIAVIAASGKAGSLIAQKAFGRGHEVTAIVRNKARLKVEVTTILEKDIFAADLYEQILAQKNRTIPRNEYTREIVLL